MSILGFKSNLEVSFELLWTGLFGAAQEANRCVGYSVLLKASVLATPILKH